MRLTDRLIKTTNKKSRQSPYDEYNEETMTYTQRIKPASINDTVSIFDGTMQTGINKDKSIFDKTAVFNTSAQKNKWEG